MAAEEKGKENNIVGNAQKIVGFYKRQAWAAKVFEKIEQDSIVQDGKDIVLASSIIQSNNNLYFPAFMRINMKENGKVVGAYMIQEEEDSFSLLPLEILLEEPEMQEILPFKYRTLEKIEGDSLQVNWPEFS
ncbi:hypothetical protein [Psychrobacillus sp. BL-248-WT-3]|uniref:hypothetical protein n=1 Tax=Psychrobacillus sp. BL-248-WT-3 TaxID=2725306 RepID=UPI00146BCFE0|nr:hypothetical protein [Psychrobacillus sp. BL-248-WT-3]NME05034.1 hypothetical protein [Psychrobacillus sp. BL-248-WT-3]